MKKETVFRIPMRLRAALVFTILFIIIGIVIQSIDAGRFIFIEFFTSNYAAWFRGLGSFTRMMAYSSPVDLLSAIFSQWYYFFYTAGLISLVWIIISSLINSEFRYVRNIEEREAPQQTSKNQSVKFAKKKN